MWLALLPAALAVEAQVDPAAPIAAHLTPDHLASLEGCGVRGGGLTAEILVQFGVVVAVAETSSSLEPTAARACALGSMFGWSLPGELTGDFQVPLTFADPPEFDPAIMPQVERAVRAQYPQISYCYEQALGRNPRLSGAMEVSARIQGGGVSSVTFLQDTVGDLDLSTCVARRLSRWQFPPEADGEIVLPLSMAPAED